MKIIIGADLAPTKSNYDLFINSKLDLLLDDELKSILENADYRIFNLEVPLLDDESPILKAGPHLIAPTSTINGIKSMNVNFVNLANNHILDHGVEGLISTIKALENNSVDYAGVGQHNDMKSYHLFKLDGKTFGIYCCAEHEFSIVNENRVGANPFDPLSTPDYIKEIKKECDYLIVLYHGGKEHYRYPSPNLQKVCRKLVDKGANLVVCQHSHCIGCEEKYNNSTIVYGQGNFLFDMKNDEFWKEALLIELDIKNNSLKYIPIMKNGNGVILADNENKNRILDEFFLRSEQIKDNYFIYNEYKLLAQRNINEYIYSILPTIYKGFIFKSLNKISRGYIYKMLLKKYLDNKCLTLLNRFECETHSELMICALKDYLENSKR